MATSLFKHQIYPCPQCHVGKLHPKLAFYCAWHEGSFISAPDFPAWTCDVCGNCEYDQEALLEIDMILQMDRRRQQDRRRYQRSLNQRTGIRKFRNPEHSH
ncbi:MAG: hypothetical protein ACLFWD_13815 [Anaerolineales bacterium]